MSISDISLQLQSGYMYINAMIDYSGTYRFYWTNTVIGISYWTSSAWQL